MEQFNAEVELSDDVLFTIFTKLQPADLFNVALVCQQFRDIVSEDQFWWELVKRDIGHVSEQQQQQQQQQCESWRTYYQRYFSIRPVLLDTHLEREVQWNAQEAQVTFNVENAVALNSSNYWATLFWEPLISWDSDPVWLKLFVLPEIVNFNFGISFDYFVRESHETGSISNYPGQSILSMPAASACIRDNLSAVHKDWQYIDSAARRLDPAFTIGMWIAPREKKVRFRLCGGYKSVGGDVVESCTPMWTPVTIFDPAPEQESKAFKFATEFRYGAIQYFEVVQFEHKAFHFEEEQS